MMSTVRWMLHLCLCGLLLSHGAAQTFNRTDVVFVVSRFHEKMDQLCFLAHYRHVVFNRGDASTLQPCGLRLVDRLENVGRESFVYLNFVVEHYDRLPPAMVFLQADTQDLKTDLAEFFDKATVTLPPESDGFAYLYPSCTSSRNANHLAALTRKYGQPAKDLLLHGHQTLLHVDIKNPRYAGFGYFIVARENVLRRPKSFYVELARRIGDRNDAYEGHFYERSWSEIFLSRCAADPHKYFCTLKRGLPCGD